MRLLPTLIHFVKCTCARYKIDESHAIGHAMDVLHYSRSIVNATAYRYPYLREQEPIIYTAAVLHDMFDRKYRDPKESLSDMNKLLSHRLKPNEIETVKHIISTMSYSHVKKEGFPMLGKYQMAYHVAREADLLSAYDFDRAIIYRMHHSTDDFTKAFENSKELFDNRMFRHEEDGLFVTEYSKEKCKELYAKSTMQIASWTKVIDSYEKYI
jgi:HD superfamily phosphodiesterase